MTGRCTTVIAYVARQSWAELTFSKCEVVKVNPKRSRVRFLEGGIAPTGSERLVPNEAIRKSAKPGSPSAILDLMAEAVRPA